MPTKLWLLGVEMDEVIRQAKANSPPKNRNQEKDPGGPSASIDHTGQVVFDRPLSIEEQESVRQPNYLLPMVSPTVGYMDSLMSRVVMHDIRDTGIGNFGGPIARRLKEPGPLNGRDGVQTGKNRVYITPFCVKLKRRKKKRPQEPGPDSPLCLPWNESFVNAHLDRAKSNDKIISDTKAKQDEYLQLKSDMRNLIISSPPKPKLEQQAVTVSDILCLDSPVEKGQIYSNLHATANAVGVPDLVEIASWIKPPPSAVPIIGYIAILLGINPDWNSAKRLILKNIPLLHSFITQVQVDQISKDRLLAAVKWREEHIPVLSAEGIEKVNKALAKLTRWILIFNRIIIWENESEVNRQRELEKNKSYVEKEPIFPRRRTSVGRKKSVGFSETLSSSRKASNFSPSRKASSIAKEESTFESTGHESHASDEIEPSTRLQFNIDPSIDEQFSNSKGLTSRRGTALGAKSTTAASHSRPASRSSVDWRVSPIIVQLQYSAQRGAEDHPGSDDFFGSNDAVFVNGTGAESKSRRKSQRQKSLKPIQGFDTPPESYLDLGNSLVQEDGFVKLTNGKDISLYQDVLLPHETLNSTKPAGSMSGIDVVWLVKAKR